MAGSSRELFDDTILEFIGETSEASEDDIHTLLEALPLDWETMPPAPAPPIPAIGELHPSFAHTTLPESEKCEREYCQVNWNGSVKKFNVCFNVIHVYCTA